LETAGRFTFDFDKKEKKGGVADVRVPVASVDRRVGLGRAFGRSVQSLIWFCGGGVLANAAPSPRFSRGKKTVGAPSRVHKGVFRIWG